MHFVILVDNTSESLGLSGEMNCSHLVRYSSSTNSIGCFSSLDHMKELFMDRIDDVLLGLLRESAQHQALKAVQQIYERQIHHRLTCLDHHGELIAEDV